MTTFTKKPKNRHLKSENAVAIAIPMRHPKQYEKHKRSTVTISTPTRPLKTYCPPISRAVHIEMSATVFALLILD